MENYYIYVYLNQTKPGVWRYRDIVFNYEPFYIGKGKGNRLDSHIQPYMLSVKSMKSSIIKNIIRTTGELPLHFKILEGLTEIEAYTIEKDIIKHFGRKDINSGILSNHTDGGIGSKNLNIESKSKISYGNSKELFQYSLEGNFIKKWDSVSSVGEVVSNFSNIPTSIKRGGTCGGYIWSYEFLGETIEQKSKYQMPVKYNNIKQIDCKTGELIETFKTALEIEELLSLRKGARNKIYECINNKLKTAYGYKWEI